MILKILLISLVSVLVSCESENVAETAYAVELSPDTFNNAIEKNNHFVMFYAPW